MRRKKQTTHVYLLHFEHPISEHHTAQHYLGFAECLQHRISQHRRGQGARLTQVAKERGIAFRVVRVWEGDRTLERSLKNRKNASLLCPICNPAAVQLGMLADDERIADMIRIANHELLNTEDVVF
jgi:predicted GIY-YIG superfamily endonuclease